MGDWRNSFSEAYIENLCPFHSDHCPILLCYKGLIVEKNAWPFHFQTA